MAMKLGLRAPLAALVEERYQAAKENQDLSFAHSEVALIRLPDTGIDYQLRFCPSLAKKPTDQRDRTKKHQEQQQSSKSPVDPFIDPPAALHIANVPTSHPSHILVLNKFPIIAGHFILATLPFESQTAPLTRLDLHIAYAVLQSWSAIGTDASATTLEDTSPTSVGNEDDDHDHLVAFFNSGSESGASQPHRHIQFLPSKSMTSDLPDWTPLTTRLLSTAAPPPSHLPIPIHQARFSCTPPSPEELEATYYALLASAFPTPQLEPDLRTALPRLSYNLAMTKQAMTLVARAKGEVQLDLSSIQPGVSQKDHASESEVDASGQITIGVNGSLLVGTLMVKERKAWDALRARTDLLSEVLRRVVNADSPDGSAGPDHTVRGGAKMS